MDPGADSAWLGGADAQRRYTSRLVRHVLTGRGIKSCASGQARPCWRSWTSTDMLARLNDRSRQLWFVNEGHLLRVLPVTRSTDGAHMSAFVALAIPTPTQSCKHLHGSDAGADSEYADAATVSSWAGQLSRLDSACLLLTRLCPVAVHETQRRSGNHVASR